MQADTISNRNATNDASSDITAAPKNQNKATSLNSPFIAPPSSARIDMHVQNPESVDRITAISKASVRRCRYLR